MEGISQCDWYLRKYEGDQLMIHSQVDATSLEGARKSCLYNSNVIQCTLLLARPDIHSGILAKCHRSQRFGPPPHSPPHQRLPQLLPRQPRLTTINAGAHQHAIPGTSRRGTLFVMFRKSRVRGSRVTPQFHGISSICQSRNVRKNSL